MLRRWLALPLCLLLATSLRGAATQMSVEEIRPGMVGIGRTVFDGTHVEEFKAHILGVLENVIGPRRNLILAKLEGGPLANTGVIAGMSGSPVFVDGRLIGAVSYALGTRAPRVSAHAGESHVGVPARAELEPPLRRST